MSPLFLDRLASEATYCTVCRGVVARDGCVGTFGLWWDSGVVIDGKGREEFNWKAVDYIEVNL